MIMARLDIEQRYGFRDKNEVTWGFIYRIIGDEEGWFAFMQHPGSEKAMCIGILPEAEVKKLITENPPLTEDDLIDLEMWMLRGGLDAYAPREKKSRKPRVKKEKN
jgi:hypothetical protein